MSKDQRSKLFETPRLAAVTALPEDIPPIIQMEEDPLNRDFLWIGTPEEHLAEIEDPEHILLLFWEREQPLAPFSSPSSFSPSAPPVGYALIHLNREKDIFELRRIAIQKKNQGLGREAMKGLFDFAFRQCGTNRFWLDAFPDNLAGIHLYESLGMHRDGVLRQSDKGEHGYRDQIIYSLLREEYTK